MFAAAAAVPGEDRTLALVGLGLVVKFSTPPTLAMLPLGFVKNAATRVRALPLPLLEVSGDGPNPRPTPPDPRPGTGEVEEGVLDPDEP